MVDVDGLTKQTLAGSLDSTCLKAARGIRTCADALSMLRAGATRLGTSAGRAIVEGVDG